MFLEGRAKGGLFVDYNQGSFFEKASYELIMENLSIVCGAMFQKLEGHRNNFVRKTLDSRFMERRLYSIFCAMYRL